MAQIDTLKALARNVLKKTGDTMISGFLTLFQDPVEDMHAVTKRYVDALGSDDPGRYITRGWDYVGDATADYQGGASPMLDAFYLGAMASTGMNTFIMNNGQILAWPFIVGRTGIVDRFQIEIISPDAGNFCRFAVYLNASRTRMYPTTRIFDSGNISTGAAGVAGSTGLSIQLNKGQMYWAVFTSDTSTATCRALDDSTLMSFAATNASGLVVYSGFTFNTSFAGGLPDPFYANGGGSLGAAVGAVALGGFNAPAIRTHFIS